jgi:hypothetical protein
MPWFRMDDKFHGHPKVIAAGNEAIGLWARCGTYAAEHSTDGFISEEIAVLYGACDTGSRRNPGTGKPETLAETLVRTRLWRRVRGGWKMPDFLDYNPSREEVVDKRKVRAEAGRKGGLASGKARSKREANASGVASAVLEPPSRPLIGADVVSQSNRSSAPASELIDVIKVEILTVTGRSIDNGWAQRVADAVLKGRQTANPIAYVRQAIRAEPDPRTRFLPVY